jgi:MerR family mercuric resistance operon transcriptional regulator
MSSTATLTTGEVADQAGVNLQTVRYYERRGLIPEPPRTAGGFRQYAPEAVSRIRFVKRAQELGFTLDEIDELLALRADAGADAVEVKHLAEAKAADIAAKIRDLQRMKETLDALAAACSGEGSTSDCSILHALDDSAR